MISKMFNDENAPNLNWVLELGTQKLVINTKPYRIGVVALIVVPRRGLEPPHPKIHAPEACASTNSATSA